MSINRTANMPDRRLPFEPLERVLRARFNSMVDERWDVEHAQAEFLGVAWRTLVRMRQDGNVRMTVADEIACRLGMHPYCIWGDEWWSDVWEHDAQIAADVGSRESHVCAPAGSGA